MAEASPKTKSYLKDLFNRESTHAEAQSIIREMEKSITDNVWITHFKNIKTGQGWVDFENEISSIVQEFESVRSEIIDNINLVKIIGQDTLISMLHGRHPHIVLQQQQDAV